ncbi:hypothetical protein ACLMJK_005704 [Lecanora helva]
MAPKPPTNPRPPSSRPSTSSLKTPYSIRHKTNKAPTKRLKQRQKHTTLLSRLTHPSPSHNSKITKKRRRPSKKLVTGLEELGDALPDASTVPENGTGGRDGKGDGGVKIKHKSLKSRPGAQRRKEKVVAMEMERFGRNLAQMSAGVGRGESGHGGGMMGVEREEGERRGGTAERWAAIRGFVRQTMERRGEGVGEGKG